MTRTPWINRLCKCGRRNEDHDDSSYNDAGDCLRVAELPSRPAYDVTTETRHCDRAARDADNRAARRAIHGDDAEPLACGTCGSCGCECATADAMRSMHAAANEDGE